MERLSLAFCGVEDEHNAEWLVPKFVKLCIVLGECSQGLWDVLAYLKL